MIWLTPRNKEVKEYLDKDFNWHGPTEIAHALGLNNSSYVMNSLKKLVKSGWYCKKDGKYKKIKVMSGRNKR